MNQTSDEWVVGVNQFWRRNPFSTIRISSSAVYFRQVVVLTHRERGPREPLNNVAQVAI